MIGTGSRVFDVAATQASRWRAGHRWTPEPQPVEEDALSHAEWQQLLDDPRIVVTGDGTPFDLVAGHALPPDLQIRLNRAEWYESRASDKVRHCQARLEAAIKAAGAAESNADRVRAEAGEYFASHREPAPATTTLEAPSDPAPDAPGVGEGREIGRPGDPADGASTSAGEGRPDREREVHPTREERIRGAVATALETDGPELRTSTGRPVLARVREISGLPDVTAAERDAAWAAVQAD